MRNDSAKSIMLEIASIFLFFKSLNDFKYLFKIELPISPVKWDFK